MITLDALDQTLREWERTLDLSGSVLVTQGEQTLFEGAYGFRDRGELLPVTPTTRFGLASVTKMFTASAIAGLVAEGRLNFDAAVVEVLPPQRRPSTLRPDVKIHHLLTHTSGIADYAEEDESSPGYVEDYGALWADHPNYRMLSPADFLPLFGDLDPYRPPGQRWQYSNAGYVLLGLVLEEVTSRAYKEAVEERVLARAAMRDSGFFRLDDARPNVAVGYLRPPSPDTLWTSNIYSIPAVGGPDGGAFSTAGDLDRFLRRHADGTLLGAATDKVLARHVDIGNGFSAGYGVIHYPDGRYGHGGRDPGVECLVHRFPALDANLVVLCNLEGVAGKVRDAVLDAWRP